MDCTHLRLLSDFNEIFKTVKLFALESREKQIQNNFLVTPGFLQLILLNMINLMPRNKHN